MRKLLCALLALTFSSTLFAGSAFDTVCRARELLAPGAWSRVISVGVRSASALSVRRVYGLVFEFNSILWLYRPDCGTESISHSRGNTESEQQDLPSLLREVFPKMQDYRSEEPDKGGSPAAAPVPQKLPNACFLKSIQALENLRGQEQCTKIAFLCYYYADGRAGGHTVLYFEKPEGCYVLDPTLSPSPTPVNGGEDPLAIANQLEPAAVVARARFLPIEGATGS